MSIRPIEKVHVGDAVFDQLKKLILSGEWTPGTRIPPENALQQQFGVSRISVRSALERLKSLGLIESRQGSGTFVCSSGGSDHIFDGIIPVYVQGNRDMIEILDFRLAIECAAARLACQRMSQQDLARLNRLYVQMRQSVNDADRIAELDLDFHLQIVRLSHNRYLYQVEQILRDILSANFRKVIDAIGPGIGIRFHELILDAFARKDAIQAERLMQEHIEQTIACIRDHVASSEIQQDTV